MMENQKKYQIIADFLRRIQEDGYPMGTGVQLKAQELISRLPEDISIDDLKSYIVPIFARSKDEQDRFQGHFLDAVLLSKEIDESNLEEIKEEPLPKKDWTKWLWRLIPLLFIPLIVFGIKYIIQGDDDGVVEEITFKPHIEKFQVESGKTAYICLDSIPSNPDFGRIVGEESQTTQVIKDSIFGKYYIDVKTQCLEYNTNALGNEEYIFLDTIFFTWSNQLGQTILVKYVGEILGEKEEVEDEVKAKKQEIEPEKPEYFKKRIPYNEGYQRIFSDPLTDSQKIFLNNYWWIFPLCGLILLMAFILLIREFFIKKNEGPDPTLVAELESKNLPPYVWNIQLEGNGDVALDDDILMTLRQLKERANDEGIRLDVSSTINKTIKEGGRFTPNYKRFTKFPEYLILIEKRSPNDHRAMLYNNLYQYFKANEIHVERYYFNTDIRVCYNDEFKNGIKLTALAKKYGDSRLVIMGSGSYLLNPMSGKLAKWTSIFEEWKERALMTPKTLDVWSRQENRLEELFTVMPTSHQCLSHWAYVLKHDLDWDKSRWKGILAAAQTRKIVLGSDVSNTLSEHFSESLKIWIATCAVYPSLYWDLTIHLGHFLADELGDEELVSNAHLADMFRLKWFADGSIPPAARADLIAFLQTEHPQLLKKIRKNLNEVLENNQPPVYSVAYDEHRMNIALNQWVMEEDSKKKKELEAEIEKYLHHGIEADFVMIKQISEKQRTALQFEVPKQWNKYVADDEESLAEEGEGTRKSKKNGCLPWLRKLGLLAFMAFMALLMFALYNNYNQIFKDKENCLICKKFGEYSNRYISPEGDECMLTLNFFPINEVQTCPKNDTDYLLYLNHFVINEIQNGFGLELDTTTQKELNDLDKYESDKFINYMDTLVDAPVKLYKNLAVAYYNKAVEEFNNSNEAKDYLPKGQVFTPKKNPEMFSFCGLIKEAYKYDKTDNDIIRMMVECENDLESVETLGGRILAEGNNAPIENISINLNNKIVKTNSNGEYEIIRDNTITKGIVSGQWFKEKEVDFESNIMGSANKIDDIYLAPKEYRIQIVDQDDKPIKGLEVFNYTFGINYKTDIEGYFVLAGNSKFKEEFIELGLLLDSYENKTITIYGDDTKNPNPRKYVLLHSSRDNDPQRTVMLREGLEIIRENGKEGLYYIDSNNPADRIVLPVEYDKIDIEDIGDGELFVRLEKGNEFYFFLTDFKGEANLSRGIQGPYGSVSESIEEDFVIVKLKDRFTYANIYGARMASMFDEALPFKNGRANVTLDGKSFVINKDGECVENCGDDYKDLLRKADGFLKEGKKYEALDALRRANEIRSSTQLKDRIDKLRSELVPDLPYPDKPDFGIEMVNIKGGTFMMGCDENIDYDCEDAEKPRHQVNVPDFQIGKYEVTQEQWRAVMGTDSPELGFKGCDKCPVESVSWNDVQEFIKKLNEKTSKNYRLPTEAEWEYAARAGQDYIYSGSNNINDVAWYDKNSEDKTHPVGKKSPNGYGLYDMTGNVTEWCEDKWHDDYEEAPSDGSAWLSGDNSPRVIRGGSWLYDPRDCRVSSRNNTNPSYRSDLVGFRLAHS